MACLFLTGCEPCHDDEVQRDGRCVTLCNSNLECTRTEQCVDGACAPAEESPGGVDPPSRSASSSSGGGASSGVGSSTGTAASSSSSTTSGGASSSSSSSGGASVSSSSSGGAGTSTSSSGGGDGGVAPGGDGGNVDAGCAPPLTWCQGTCVDTNTSTAFCGSCATSCGDDHATPDCVAGACVPQCQPGWGSCDTDGNNGCETPLDTTSNCRACGVVCGGVHALATCGAQGCELQCETGWDDCDGNPANGCETYVLLDARHCGSCPTTCNADEACTLGTCVLSGCADSGGMVVLNPTSDAFRGSWAREPALGAWWPKIDDDGAGDGDNTYVWDDTVGAVGSAYFGHEDFDLPTELEVREVAVIIQARRVNAEGNVRPALFLDNNFFGAETTLTTNYQFIVLVFGADPATGGAWTPQAVQEAKLALGSTRNTQNNPVRVTQLWAEVCIAAPDSGSP
ncbi:MAG: hypothetical protein AB2A00_30235 [Myxococcota bacterium]